MSFEGRYQKLCPNNHYEEQNVYMETSKCRICEKKWVKSNLVDDTNFVGEGFDFAMASVNITENDLLKSQLKEALEVIRFYATMENWDFEEIDKSDVEFCEDPQADLRGKRARDFLLKLEGKCKIIE